MRNVNGEIGLVHQSRRVLEALAAAVEVLFCITKVGRLGCRRKETCGRRPVDYARDTLELSSRQYQFCVVRRLKRRVQDFAREGANQTAVQTK